MRKSVQLLSFLKINKTKLENKVGNFVVSIAQVLVTNVFVNGLFNPFNGLKSITTVLLQ